MNIHSIKKAAAMAAVASAALWSGSVRAEADGTRIIQNFIRQLDVGRPVSVENLTVVPVYIRRAAIRSGLTTLDEAIQNGWLVIKELEGGRVPQVELTNKSERTIFILAGEILTGCKQDRIVAGDVLIRPWKKSLVLPVYCVEAGRWTHSSVSFGSNQNLGTFKLRSYAQQQSASAQSKIWEEISSENEKMAVASDTSAYQDAYENERNKSRIALVEEKMKSVPRLYDDTIGVVIALGGRIVSADLFPTADIFQKLWPKILKSSALASITLTDKGELDQKEAADFLGSLRDMTYALRPGLDLGTEASAAEKGFSVTALVDEEGMVHLASFPTQEEEKMGGRIPVIREPSIQQSVRMDGPEADIRVRR